MKLHTNQRGFSAVEVFIVVAILAIVGLVGYNVYSKQTASKDSGSSTSQSAQKTGASSDVADAPEIKTTKDLDTASATLDKINVDSTSDEKQLDQDTAAF